MLSGVSTQQDGPLAIPLAAVVIGIHLLRSSESALNSSSNVHVQVPPPSLASGRQVGFAADRARAAAAAVAAASARRCALARAAARARDRATARARAAARRWAAWRAAWRARARAAWRVAAWRRTVADALRVADAEADAVPRAVARAVTAGLP